MAAKRIATVSKVYCASTIPSIASLLKASISADNKLDIQDLPLVENGTSMSQEWMEKIPQIEFLFGDPAIIGQVLSHPHNKLKWAQSTFAGVEPVVTVLKNSEKLTDAVVTRLADGFGQTMAEYVLGQIIARERNFPLMYELQKKALFDHTTVDKYRKFSDLNIGIIGLGNIGTEVARQCRCLNSTVWAAVRDERFSSGQSKCEHVHNLRPMSQLEEMLQEVDYVVNILPSTPQTRGLLNGDVFKACSRKKSVFINIGRGNVIDDDSLINALRCGWLGGAILDVFNTEPLPSSSPLWTLPGVTLTPHVSGATDPRDAVKTFLKNLELYETGQPLMHQLDASRGY